MADVMIPQGLTEQSSTKKIPLGTEVIVDGNTYRYVQVHASGTAGAAYKAMFRYAAATANVLTAAGAAGNLFVGVCPGTIDVGYYGWVMVDGETVVYTDEASSVSTCLAGSPLFAGSTAGALAFAQLGVSTAQTFQMYKACGYVTVPTVSSTSTVRFCTAKIKAIV